MTRVLVVVVVLLLLLLLLLVLFHWSHFLFKRDFKVKKIFINGIPTEVLGYISKALYQLSYSNNVTQ